MKKENENQFTANVWWTSLTQAKSIELRDKYLPGARMIDMTTKQIETIFDKFNNEPAPAQAKDIGEQGYVGTAEVRSHPMEDFPHKVVIRIGSKILCIAEGETPEIAKANAQRIVQSVNGYEALKNDLAKAMEAAYQENVKLKSLLEVLELSRQYIANYGKPPLNDIGAHNELKMLTALIQQTLNT